MIRIGIAGLGFMGSMHAWGLRGRHTTGGRKVEGGELVAIASADPRKRAGDWSGIRGNYGPRGGPEDVAGIRMHASVEGLIADPGVDLVHVCLPNPLHRPVTEAALAAGKHVFVEKPIALTLADADAMIAAAHRASRVLCVAHVVPFRAEYAFAVEAVRSGRFGAPLGGAFKRLLARHDGPPDPARLFTYGGMGLDLHIHDTHFIRMLFGPPREVRSRGTLVGDGLLDYVTTQYAFADPRLVVTSQSGAISAAARPFVHGFELYFERATLAFESGAIPLTVFGADGAVTRPELPARTDVDSFTDQVQVVVDMIRSGSDPGPLAAARGRDALALCLAEAESVRRGEPVRFA